MKVIAKGKVRMDGGVYFLSVPDDPTHPRTTIWRGWSLGKWAEPYWGKWLTISLEEAKETEMETLIDVLQDTVLVLQSHRFRASRNVDEIMKEVRSLDRLIYQLKQVELSLSFDKQKTQLKI